MLGAEFHADDVRALVKRFAPQQYELKTTHIVRLTEIELAPWHPSVRLDEEAMAAFTEEALTRQRLEPMLLRRIAKSRYQLLAGVRWLEAARRIGDETAPAIVIDVDDATAIAISFVYALSRERLTAWEEAQALAELKETLSELGQESDERVLARLMDKSETWVRSRLLIARQLTPDVIQAAALGIHDLYVMEEKALSDAASGETVDIRAERLRGGHAAGHARRPADQRPAEEPGHGTATDDV